MARSEDCAASEPASSADREIASHAIPENATARVRADVSWVSAQATHVHINRNAVLRSANRLQINEARRIFQHKWDDDLHLDMTASGDAVMVQYLLVLDALNFCFWPEAGLEYEHLARGLKDSVQEDGTVLEASRLAEADGPAVQRLLRRLQPLPLQEERASLLREIGTGLQRHWGGHAVQMVAAAQGSAVTLVNAVLKSFPGFRDFALYRGRQVWLLKRAQIFVGDLWGAFGGRGCGAFHDIGDLTAFADYRIPVVLRQMGILNYSPELARLVDSHTPLAAGTDEEIELRACTVVSVEEIRKALQERFEEESSDGSIGGDVQTSKYEGASKYDSREAQPEALPQINSVAVDWWLWEMGEKHRDGPDAHHRTITTFY